MRYSKEFRILDLYQHLIDGCSICKREYACRYGVSERSIQRDIDAIRSFLANRAVIYGNDSRSILFERKNGAYRLTEFCKYRNVSTKVLLFPYLQNRVIRERITL